MGPGRGQRPAFGQDLPGQMLLYQPRCGGTFGLHPDQDLNSVRGKVSQDTFLPYHLEFRVLWGQQLDFPVLGTLTRALENWVSFSSYSCSLHRRSDMCLFFIY